MHLSDTERVTEKATSESSSSPKSVTSPCPQDEKCKSQHSEDIHQYSSADPQRHPSDFNEVNEVKQDEIIPAENGTSVSSTSEIDGERTRLKKPKSEKSVLHDKQRGVWICKKCGWCYPNARPNAKQRRDHKKQCGKFQGVQDWFRTESMQSVSDTASDVAAAEVTCNDVQKDVPTIASGAQANGNEAASSKENEQIHSSTLQKEEPKLKEKIAYVNDADDGSVNSEMKTVENDIEKVLAEQKSHDLLCPVCGSCITKRIILRKRKRNGFATAATSDSEAKWQRVEEIEANEPLTVSIGGIHHEQLSQESISSRGVIEDDGQVEEEWGCLSCFSFFFRRIRGVRSQPLTKPLLEGIKEEEQSTVTEAKVAASDEPELVAQKKDAQRKEDVQGKEDQRKEAVEVQRKEDSKCFPLEFSWRQPIIADSNEQQQQAEEDLPAIEKKSEKAKEEEQQAGFNCMEGLFSSPPIKHSPAFDRLPFSPIIERQPVSEIPSPDLKESSEGTDTDIRTNIPQVTEDNAVVVPILPEIEEDSTVEKKEDKSILSYIPYVWRTKEKGVQDEKLPETSSEKKYITRDTRIQALIRTITSVVTVSNNRNKGNKMQIGDSVTYVDLSAKDRRSESIENQINILQEQKDSRPELITKPSTGWAMIQEMDDESLAALQPEIQPETEPQQILTDGEGTSNAGRDAAIKELLSKLPDAVSTQPTATSATVSLANSDTTIQISGDDPKGALETAIIIAQETGVIDHQQQQQQQPQEYVKSILYGGLDVSLASLALVSSAAGAQAKMLNLLALCVANLVAGFIALLCNIVRIYSSDKRRFEELIGQKLWMNGILAVISYVVFGCIPLVTYVFSFGVSGDKDYKFGVTAAASMLCFILLGFAKSHVQRKPFLTTVITLIVTGFAASVSGYFVGDYLQRWLTKIGFETKENSQPPTSMTTTTVPISPLIIQSDSLSAFMEGLLKE